MRQILPNSADQEQLQTNERNGAINRYANRTDLALLQERWYPRSPV